MGLEKNIANLKSQLKILSEKDKVVREDRRRDHEEWVARTERSEEVIEALELIIPKLQSLAPKDMMMALAELEKIGKSNPIGAFVQVASSLDPAMLKTVIDKMVELGESLRASVEEDRQHEIAA